LREMEGLNYDEIARITEASRATVIGQLLRARQMLTTSQTQNIW
jgi:DNA-directed RNA polymerase specialized sigma24 family protein